MINLMKEYCGSKNSEPKCVDQFLKFKELLLAQDNLFHIRENELIFSSLAFKLHNEKYFTKIDSSEKLFGQFANTSSLVCS